jgi:UDP-glucose 4,6-dehydratase
MYNFKNILVTGGCGFIGSNFINEILKNNSNKHIINIDCLNYCADQKNVDYENTNNNKYTFIEGNICSMDLIKFILKEYQIDTIVHFAAQSHVDNSFSNSLQYTQDNIVGTHTLLEASRLYGKITRFIHVSTDEVYGESNLKEDEEKKTEYSILTPTNPYAATKAGAEMIAMSYNHSYGMPIIVSRGNNVYGPRQYPEKLIPKFIKLLKEGQKLTIHGNGINKRSFLYVSDVAEAFIKILEKGKVGEIYNIGSEDENEFSVMDVTKMIVSNIKETDKIDNYIEFVKDRDFNDKRYYIDNNKLKELGWKQKVKFKEGLIKTIDWYKNKL